MLIKAWPLGKLYPLAASSNGVNGRSRRKINFKRNMSNRLLSATTGTFMEYQRCFFINRKYAASARLAGIRNVWVPKKVKNCITSVLISLTRCARKLNARWSKYSFFSLKIILARTINANNAALKTPNKTIISMDKSATAA